MGLAWRICPLIMGIAACSGHKEFEHDTAADTVADSAGTDTGAEVVDSTPNDSASVTDSNRQIPQPPAWGGAWHRAGQRLNVLIASTGSAYAPRLGYADRLLKSECRPVLASDGQVRCVPLAGDFDVAYADSRCSRQIYKARTPSCQVSMRIWQRVDSRNHCGFPERVAVWTPQPYAPAQLYVRDDDDQCVAVTDPDLTGWYIVDSLLDTPVDPRTFVALTETTVMGPDGLGVRGWLGEDGSWSVHGLADSGGACRPLQALGVCMPGPITTRYNTSDFADASCQAPAVVDGAEASCPPSRTIKQDNDGEDLDRYYEVQSSQRIIYKKEPTRCFASSIGHRALVRGDEREISSLVTVHISEVGTGLLKARVWLAGQGSAPRAPDADHPFVNALRLPSVIWRGTTGQRVALPGLQDVVIMGQVDTFSDETCSIPWLADPLLTDASVVVVLGDSASCGGDDSAPVVKAAWSIGATLPGKSYVFDDGECVIDAASSATGHVLTRIDLHADGYRIDTMPIVP